MAAGNRKTFSLISFFLFVLISALVISQVVMMMQLAESQKKMAEAWKEVEDVRKKYGHVEVVDPSLIYFAEIPEGGEWQGKAYRIHFPAVNKYMLNVADATFEKDGFLDDPVPVHSVSLVSWRDGADLVLTHSLNENNGMWRLDVTTQAEHLCHYEIGEWDCSSGACSGGELNAAPQRSFKPGERIPIKWIRNGKTKRGVMVWLETVADWEARRKRLAAEKEAQKGAK